MSSMVVLVVMLLAGASWADILEWRDAAGVAHYTNLRDEIPDAQRADAQVVVNEAARHPVSTESAAPEPAPPPEPRRQAQVIYDRSEVSQAYVDGMERGLEAARTANGGGGGVQINGPLAIANASAPQYYPYVPPYFAPLVTTSFDRGRSRHLTLRMLLQDQFELDREGPFGFDNRLVAPLGYAPLGVELNPFLPRGLPHRFPRQTRVITR